MRKLALVALPLLVAGCATPGPAPGPLPTASVTAKVETTPVGTLDDAADDPAIWRNAANPAESLIVATDKNRRFMSMTLQATRCTARRRHG